MQKITFKRALLFSLALMSSIMLLVGLCFTVFKLSVFDNGLFDEAVLKALDLFKTTGIDFLSFKFSKTILTAAFEINMNPDFVKMFGYVFGSMSLITLLVAVGAIITIVVGFFKIGDSKAYKIIMTFAIIGLIVTLVYSITAIVFNNIVQTNFEKFLINEEFVVEDAVEIKDIAKFTCNIYVSAIFQAIFLIAIIVCSLTIKESSKKNATRVYEEKRNTDSIEEIRESIEAFSDLLKNYKQLSESGVINMAEYIEKNAKIVNFYVEKVSLSLSLISKRACVKDIMLAENVTLEIIKKAKDLLDNNYITTENYLTARAKIMSAVIK